MVKNQTVNRGKRKKGSISDTRLRIVGVGASAGGLEALRDFVAALPPAAPFSYIVVQHVSPTHVSLLMNLLAPMTKLTVQDLRDRQRPEPGVVYITPPNRDVTLRDGVLHLTEPEETVGPKPSINRFFNSLARELGEHTIAIILSGTGSDGAAGMRAIKAEGGITIIQEPATAKYDGMPKFALRTGSVDLIMPADQIGSTLERLLKAPIEQLAMLDEGAQGDSINAMMTLVRRHTGFNLNDYKRTTVLRRIKRRLSILGLSSFPDYLSRLKDDRAESMALMRDTLITVTSFFRDPESPETVKTCAERVGMQVNEQLAQRYAPASVVLAEDDTVKYFTSGLKPYLRFPQGQASMCLFDMVDASLCSELRALVYRCRRDQKEVRGGIHRIMYDGQQQDVRPVVAPLPGDLLGLLIISFEPVNRLPRVERESLEGGEHDNLIIGELERELANTRTHLQTVVEELETSNEELQSVNEELQSTNQELQTANEGLQSTNEALLTVNDEVQIRSTELETTASDLANVKESLRLPLMVVDRNLLITQKNDAIEQIAVFQGEIKGQSLTTVEWRVELPSIVNLVRAVMDSGDTHEQVITDGGRHFYEMRIMPYCGERTTIDGAILLFQDITAHKRTEEKLALAASVFENTIDGIMVTDAEGVILQVNKAFTGITGYSSEEAIGQTPRLLRSEQHDDTFRSEMWRSLQVMGAWQGEIWNRHKDGHVFPLWQTISSVRDHEGHIRRYIATYYDITEQKLSEERIYRLAHYDVVTKLPNRLLFVDRLRHALERSKRESMQMAVFFIDLDHFKTINDTLGHPMGDKLLQQVAEKLNQCLRRQDTVARIGGDEFTILLENIKGVSAVETVSRKVLHALSKPFCVEEQETFISGSIGISVYPEDGLDVDTLLKNADLAMYRAKELGRNRYQFYARDMAEEAEDRLRLLNALRQAIVGQEFLLHYQPLTHLEDRALVGAEALIRWHHPTMGLIAPDKFIPLAEETREIDVIGEWVLRIACAQLRAWLDAGFPPMRLAVNISGQQLKRGNLADVARKVIEDTGCPAELLDLEITESFIMREADQSIRTLKRLRDLGFDLVIDDFGTGYSSLSYLKRIPVTKLKVDRSFVHDIPQDPNNKAIAKAIIGLGKSLGLTVVAEGIETAAQEAFLIGEGCHQGQGYLYSRPVPAHDFQEILRAQPTIVNAAQA